MDNNSIKQLYLELPNKYKNKLLFFNSWGSHIDNNMSDVIMTMTATQKLAVYNELKPKSTIPTKDNYWIWFGRYNGKGATARQGTKSVIVKLYEHFIEPVPATGIRKSTRYSKMDVNPFKIYHSYNSTGEIPELGLGIMREKLALRRQRILDGAMWRRLENQVDSLVMDMLKAARDLKLAGVEVLTAEALLRAAKRNPEYSDSAGQLALEELFTRGIHYES